MSIAPAGNSQIKQLMGKTTSGIGPMRKGPSDAKIQDWKALIRSSGDEGRSIKKEVVAALDTQALKYDRLGKNSIATQLRVAKSQIEIYELPEANPYAWPGDHNPVANSGIPVTLVYPYEEPVVNNPYASPRAHRGESDNGFYSLLGSSPAEPGNNSAGFYEEASRGWMPPPIVNASGTASAARMSFPIEETGLNPDGLYKKVLPKGPDGKRGPLNFVVAEDIFGGKNPHLPGSTDTDELAASVATEPTYDHLLPFSRFPHDVPIQYFLKQSNEMDDQTFAGVLKASVTIERDEDGKIKAPQEGRITIYQDEAVKDDEKGIYRLTVNKGGELLKFKFSITNNNLIKPEKSKKSEGIDLGLDPMKRHEFTRGLQEYL